MAVEIPWGGNLKGASRINVFKIEFTTELDAAPSLEAWDNTYLNTTDNAILAGTVINGSRPMICAGDTATDLQDDWHITSATVGGASVNLLRGDVSVGGSWLNFSTIPNSIGADAYVTFNLSLLLPSDCPVPAGTSLDCVFVCRYNYTGSAPLVTWAANSSASETATWEDIVAGVDYISFADAGSSETSMLLTVPASGTVYSGSIWVRQ